MKNIKIKFNNLTLYLLLIALLSGYIKNALIILFIILFHECGHIFITILLGYKIKSIELFPFGGITKIDKYLNTPIYYDLLIAIFGVIFQSIIFFLGKINIIQNEMLLSYNKTIMLFNLLPIIPLDGSKILFEVYNLFFDYNKALKYYVITSILFIIIYLFFNYKYALNNYLMIGLFLFKTIEIIKNRRIIHHKFILERMLYDDLNFSHLKNKNELPIKYYKDVKYYYNYKNKIISEKEYLSKIYK